MKKFIAMLVSVMVVMTILVSCTKKTDETPNTNNQSQNQNNNNMMKVGKLKITVDTDQEIGDVKIMYANTGNGGNMNGDNGNSNNTNGNAGSNDNVSGGTGNNNMNGDTTGNATGEMIGRGDTLEYTIDKTAGSGGFTVMVYDKAGKEIATKMFSSTELTSNTEETIMLRITDKTTGGGIEITDTKNMANNDQNNNNQNSNNQNSNNQNNNMGGTTNNNNQ